MDNWIPISAGLSPAALVCGSQSPQSLKNTPSPGWGVQPCWPQQTSNVSQGWGLAFFNLCWLPGDVCKLLSWDRGPRAPTLPPASMVLWTGRPTYPLIYLTPSGESELEDLPDLYLQFPKWVLSPLSFATHLPSGMGRWSLLETNEKTNNNNNLFYVKDVKT